LSAKHQTLLRGFLSSNIKFVLIATVVVLGQGVVWYSGQFGMLILPA
jgi:hypothetical protein